MNAVQIKEAIANDLQSALDGKLDPEAIDRAAQTIRATSTSYPANGSVASFIFYLKWQVVIDGGQTFDGNSGGVATPGGGALFGDVYTDDIDELYSDTESFQFTATSVYTSLIFFDGDSNVLGTFQAGAVSTVNGVGGGSGGWS